MTDELKQKLIQKMNIYHYEGEVLMSFQKEEEPVKFNIQTDVEAPSLDKAYSYLADLIRYATTITFNGTITEAKELEQRVEGLEKQMSGIYDILDRVADSDKASVDLFMTLTDKVIELEKKIEEDAND